MPQVSIYYSDDGKRSYTPTTFVEKYNEYDSNHAAALGMGINLKRIAVIASRLRSRGRPVQRFDTR